uniref:OB domain-containing protein n=1 Tax=Rhabditophanes sp. KR3021 TaxID=114890 RepID=A0AC35TSI3_9BILA
MHNSRSHLNINSQPVEINKLIPGQKSVCVKFIIIEKGDIKKTQQGRSVVTLKIGDRTGIVQMVIWNDIADVVKVGDVCNLENGVVNAYKGILQLSCGKFGKLHKVDELCLAINEQVNMSEYNEKWVINGPN